MLLSWNGVYESKELHKMEEMKEKETKEKLKLSTIRIVVISETCLLIIRHKKKVMLELKLTPESGWSGRDNGVIKSFALSGSTTKPTK